VADRPHVCKMLVGDACEPLRLNRRFARAITPRYQAAVTRGRSLRRVRGRTDPRVLVR
jgi:hypothetical protein